MERALWFAIVTSALASSGCGDECKSWDSYCDGNVLHLCVPGGYKGHAYWHVADCEDNYCVEYEVDGSGAQCAREQEARPACAPGQTDDWTCDGAERVACSHGFVVDLEDCGDPTLCEIEINQCVARPGIDARCEQLPQPASGVAAGYCDVETAIRCIGPYVIEIVECASKSMQCYELWAGVYPVCVAATTPDARCNQQDGGVYNHCIGNLAVSCANDRLISATNCSGVCENGFCH
jgi:hypothetical protein